MPIATSDLASAPLSSPLSINGLIKSRASTHAQTKILAGPNRDLVFEQYTYNDIDTAATLLANYYASEAGGAIPLREVGDSETKMTVGLMAGSGWDYVVNMVALVRMGYCE